MASELENAVLVDFPLRGEWHAFNSPADRIPSHGTDMLGQRFAFDFIRVDRRKGWHVHPAGSLRSNLIGFPIREAYAWGQPVHMPFDGEIVDAEDGYPERSRIVPIREIGVVLKNALTFDPSKLRSVLGNLRARSLRGRLRRLRPLDHRVGGGEGRPGGDDGRAHRWRGPYRKLDRATTSTSS